MSRRAPTFVLIALVGCAPSTAKYDPVANQTSIHRRFEGDVILHADPDVPADFHLILTGATKKPRDWDAHLFIEFRRPKASRPVLRGNITLYQGARGAKQFESSTGVATTDFAGEDEDSVFFDMTIPEIGEFLRDGKGRVNDYPFQFTEAQRKEIESAILEAREISNG